MELEIFKLESNGKYFMFDIVSVKYKKKIKNSIRYKWKFWHLLRYERYDNTDKYLIIFNRCFKT